jgi:hypothetical protein
MRYARPTNLGQNWSTSELRWRAKSGYGNVHHAMRRLCWRIRMRSPAVTAALHKSLLAFRSGIARVAHLNERVVCQPGAWAQRMDTRIPS